MSRMKKLLGILGVISLLGLVAVGCVAPGALSVEITSPEDGATIAESPITVTGNASDAAAAVTVNGVEVDVAEDGTFSAQVELSEGENIIEAKAILSEQQVSDSVTVTYTSSIAGTGTVRYIDLEGGFYGIVSDDGQKYDPINLASDFQQDGLKIRFEAVTRSDLANVHMWGILVELTGIEKLESELLSVEITSPEDGAELTESPATVTGNVSDATAAVTVNGIAAVVAEDGTFSAQVELTEGENTITAVAAMDGLEAEDSITLTYAPEAVPTGSVEVHVTDPGADTVVTSVNITASAIEIHEAANGEEGEWIPLDITLPTFDLIELKEGGLEEILASGNVTAGKYTQIRMTIEKVEVSIGENEPQEATVPSGELKFVRPFEVSEGETTILTLDFDAEKSVNITGAEEIIFKPTVKLTITPAPVLSMEITSPEDGAELTESPVTVTGTVSDAAAAVTVNGVEVDVAEDGTFSAQVELTEGENTIEAVAILDTEEAEDSVTVTYFPVE